MIFRTGLHDAEDFLYALGQQKNNLWETYRLKALNLATYLTLRLNVTKRKCRRIFFFIAGEQLLKFLRKERGIKGFQSEENEI